MDTGTTLGHYRIIAEIGRGGMGVVFRARDEVLHREVALKVLSEDTLAQASAREFLLHEARASSALNHPNICTVHDVGEDAGHFFIVMELVDGRSLRDMLGETGLPVEAVMRYGVQVAAALGHAHGRGIVHRDLKSHNIAVTAEGLVKGLDFGLARRLPGELDADGATLSVSPLEGSSAIAGTLAYMAPEVLRGAPGDVRSDLWALGIVLYEAASGHVPFRGKTSFEISSAIMNEAAPPLAWMPATLWAIVQRCLAKDPGQRYQNAGEVRAALEAGQAASMSAPAAPPRIESNANMTTVLHGMKHLAVKTGDVLVLVGTTKGAFLLRSGAKRARWDSAGPYFHGQSIYSLVFDARDGRRRLWAATNTPLWGTFLRWSDDFGRTWTNPSTAQIKFPPESGASLGRVWKLALGRADEPGMMYCGVEPAALFESRDAGNTWSLVRSLYDHPHRPRWEPGNGGLCLHTVLLDPANRQRMYVAVSTGGVYRTDDGGVTWQARNRGVKVVFRPERYPEFGQCVHRIVLHPERPERLFLQNHWGLYRSDNAGDSWTDISNGIPYDFGFAMVVHPQHPDWVYVVPVESDEFRCAAEGKLRVYRTRNAGESWEALSRGLPQKGAYVTVLREGMCVDARQPVGIYFGTRSGEIYGSLDDGKTWTTIADGLPPVVCVQAAVIGA